jgi:hypothetical protein
MVIALVGPLLVVYPAWTVPQMDAQCLLMSCNVGGLACMPVLCVYSCALLSWFYQVLVVLPCVFQSSFGHSIVSLPSLYPRVVAFSEA